MLFFFKVVIYLGLLPRRRGGAHTAVLYLGQNGNKTVGFNMTLKEHDKNFTHRPLNMKVAPFVSYVNVMMRSHDVISDL